MPKLLVFHGLNPNLPVTGQPPRCHSLSVEFLESKTAFQAQKNGAGREVKQSIEQYALIAQIQNATSGVTKFIIASAIAVSHAGISMRIAIIASSKRFIEIFSRNSVVREPVGHQSNLADFAIGIAVVVATLRN